jgi:hypothetical protein
VKPLFIFDHVVATPGALDAIEVSGDSLSTYLARHQSSDWGEIDARDRKDNQLSLEQCFRLMSVYGLSTGVKIWVITKPTARPPAFCCQKNIDVDAMNYRAGVDAERFQEASKAKPYSLWNYRLSAAKRLRNCFCV